jgi:putative tryptophan/tyrosine transport system substrate-binding protein
VKRRDFISLLGGAAAWPLAARGQRRSMPVIGYLDTGSPEMSAHLVPAFRQGLRDRGLLDGSDVAIEYRWVRNEFARLPELVADLNRHSVSVIVALGSPQAALAAKWGAGTIPVVFGFGGDPVRNGLVTSLNRPGGNVTGVVTMNAELTPKLETLRATNNQEINTAFASLAERQLEGLIVNAEILFLNRRTQIMTLAARYRIPTIYPGREGGEGGGLMSYGSSYAEMVRQAGIYTGRVLKGERPADLPVLRPTKFELIINLQTAQALDIEVPAALLATADEVIE